MAGSFCGKERVQDIVQVACQLPEVLDQLQVGVEVWIDEGNWERRWKRLCLKGCYRSASISDWLTRSVARITTDPGT
jgi:hypothetical protein